MDNRLLELKEAWADTQAGAMYCEDCAPEGAIPDSGECDCISHCESCHAPLDVALTPEGIRHAIETIDYSLTRVSKEEHDLVHQCYEGTYYEGERHCEILRDWCRILRTYTLTRAQLDIIDRFMQRTKRGE